MRAMNQTAAVVAAHAHAYAPGAGASGGASTDLCVIVTSTPDLFADKLASRIGRSVELTDNAATVLRLMQQGGVTRVFADFRPLLDGWTGQRFLRHIRSHAAHAEVEVWLMAERHAELDAWAIEAGANGMVRRSARAVIKQLDAADPWLANSTVSFDDDLVRVETIFRSHAGPLAIVHIAAAKCAIGEGKLDPSSQALTSYLAGCFNLTERSVSFLAAVNTDPQLSSWS